MLKGNLKGFWSISVSGNWRIVFRFDEGDASTMAARRADIHPGGIVRQLSVLSVHEPGIQLPWQGNPT